MQKLLQKELKSAFQLRLLASSSCEKQRKGADISLFCLEIPLNCIFVLVTVALIKRSETIFPRNLNRRRSSRVLRLKFSFNS